MARNILILGASYGSLLGTKLLMAGHNVTLVCRRKTAELINRDGTEVRIKLRDEAVHRAIFSRDLPGKLDATTPQDVDLSRYDLVGLAMQEPQYTNHTIRVLDDQDRRGGASVSVDHEHAALALSQADPGAGGDGSGGGLYQRVGMGAVRAGTGVAMLARSAGFSSAGRGGECPPCRPADELQGRGIRRRGAQQAAARVGSWYRRGDAGRQGRSGKAQGVRTRCSCRWRNGRCC